MMEPERFGPTRLFYGAVMGLVGVMVVTCCFEFGWRRGLVIICAFVLAAVIVVPKK